MRYIDRIGLEKEVWLLDKNDKIMEPKLYGFFHDVFGFLIEVRTRPHTESIEIQKDMAKLMSIYEAQARCFGLRIVEKPKMPIDLELIERLSYEYGYGVLQDLSANIYTGVTRTHSTGISGEWLTAGLHVHFSRHTDDGTRVQLPIQDIVKSMDGAFHKEITKAKRMHGEYENKTYGWEYRSLPATININKVLDVAFSMFLLENII